MPETRTRNYLCHGLPKAPRSTSWTPPAPPPKLSKWECATSFNPGGDPAGELDNTCLDSETMEYVAGMRNPGSATLGIRPDPDSASHITMFALSRMDPSPVIEWAVGWSDGTAAPTYGSPVDAVTVDAGGTGYTSPTVTFSAPEDPNGTTATGVATVDAGVITAITITDPGSGYQAAPTVTITGTGTGATASASTRHRRAWYTRDTRTWTTMQVTSPTVPVRLPGERPRSPVIVIKRIPAASTG